MNYNKNHCVPYGQNDEIKTICEKVLFLQKEAVRDELNEFCDRDFLGNQENGKKLNTRPVMIFTHEDKTWHCPIDNEEDDCEDAAGELTCVFRIEKVEGGSVTFRALKKINYEVPEECYRMKYESTNSFITVKLVDIAALRCLKDTFVNICIR